MLKLFFVFSATATFGIALAVVSVEADARPALSAGRYFSLALHQDGTVYSWGKNSYGQLGDGSTTTRTRPVKVTDIADVATVRACQNHALAIKADGTVWAWGQNVFGQLGDGSTMVRYRPVKVMVSDNVQLGNVTAIACGDDFSLALDNTNRVWVWGRNHYGQLGLGDYVNRTRPVQVASLSNVISIGAGSTFSIALLNDGKVRAWGSNDYGQLGINNQTSSNVPIDVLMPVNAFVQVYAGLTHVVAMTSQGDLYSWGLNNLGQLGAGSYTNQLKPLKVNLPAPVVETPEEPEDPPPASGTSASPSSGTQTPPATTTPVPPPPPPPKAVSLVVGHLHTFAAGSDFKLYGWGYNDAGQLGNGEIILVNIPINVDAKVIAGKTPIASFKELTGGFDHSLAMDSTGQVFAWGDNIWGQLGLDSSERKLVPVKVLGPAGVTLLNLRIDGGANVPDAQPDVFQFVDVTAAALASEVRSNELVVAGINVATNVAITNGEYSINGGPFTSAPGSVVNGDRIVVRHTSSAAYATGTVTLLNIGGVLDEFSSTTLEESPPAESGGGGCTVARQGVGDIGLVLLIVMALLMRLRTRERAV